MGVALYVRDIAVEKPRASRRLDRAHLKRPRLPQVKGGDWLHPLLYRVIENLLDEAWAIRNRDSRYFTTHHEMTVEQWDEKKQGLDDFVHSQQFGFTLEVLGLGEPREVTQIRNRFLCIAFGDD